MIPAKFIQQLVTLGDRADLDFPNAESYFEVLRPYTKFMVGSWNDWYPICDSLSIEENVAVLKSLVLTERIAGIGFIDSGSSAIWVYRRLAIRASYRLSYELACWVIDNSNNPWMPFGFSREVQYFKNHRDKFTDESDISLVNRIKNEINKDRLPTIMKEDQEKSERLVQKQLIAEERKALKHQRDKDYYEGLDKK